MTVPPNNIPFLFAAFAVVWMVFFIYAAYMSWRRRSFQRELRDLQETAGSDQLPVTDAQDDGPV